MGVCFDILAGTLTIGGRAIPARLMPDGGLALGDDAGLVLRPLRFAERAAAVAIGSATKDTERGVAAAITAFATVGPQAGDPRARDPLVSDPAVAEIAALHLCGADVVDLPSFAATALLLGRAAGWSLSDIGEARATEIDRLVRTLASPPADDGWTRVRFVDGGASAAVDGLDRVLRGMARNLLDRNDANAADSAAGSTGAKPADNGSRVTASTTEAAMTQKATIQAAARDDKADDARGAADLALHRPLVAAPPAVPDAGPMARGDGVADDDIAAPRNRVGPTPADYPDRPVEWRRDVVSTAPAPSPGPAPIIASQHDVKPQEAGSGRVAGTASSQRAAERDRRFRLPIRATSALPDRQAANDVLAVASPDRGRATPSGVSAMLATMPAWVPEAFPKGAGADRAWAADPTTGTQWASQPAASTLIPRPQSDAARTDAARDWDTDALIEAIAERLHDTADLRGIDR